MYPLSSRKSRPPRAGVVGCFPHSVTPRLGRSFCSCISLTPHPPPQKTTAATAGHRSGRSV
ncbi:hypothetical protein BDW69DRAFT_179444 [Aspergillus filifer]